MAQGVDRPGNAIPGTNNFRMWILFGLVEAKDGLCVGFFLPGARGSALSSAHISSLLGFGFLHIYLGRTCLIELCFWNGISRTWKHVPWICCQWPI